MFLIALFVRYTTSIIIAWVYIIWHHTLRHCTLYYLLKMWLINKLIINMNCKKGWRLNKNALKAWSKHRKEPPTIITNLWHCHKPVVCAHRWRVDRKNVSSITHVHCTTLEIWDITLHTCNTGVVYAVWYLTRYISECIFAWIAICKSILHPFMDKYIVY